MRRFGVAVRRNTKHCNDLLSDISNVDGFNSKVAHGLRDIERATYQQRT